MKVSVSYNFLWRQADWAVQEGLLAAFMCKREVKSDMSWAIQSFFTTFPLETIGLGNINTGWGAGKVICGSFLQLCTFHMASAKSELGFIMREWKSTFLGLPFHKDVPLPLQKTCGFHCFPKDLYLPRKSVCVPSCSWFRSCPVNIVLLLVQQSPQI